jgi:hypothetical protein
MFKVWRRRFEDAGARVALIAVDGRVFAMADFLPAGRGLTVL